MFFGARVTIEDEDGKRSRYRIVGSDEIDLKRGWISIDSPLAKALLGKAAGEYALVHRPKGEVEVTIRTTFVTVALDILILLALSSRNARAWARLPRRTRRTREG